MDKETNKQSPEVIFLIGAGISVPLNIPAMHGIFEAFMDKNKSGINDKDKETCQEFIKELGVDDDLEEFLLAVNTIIEFKDSGLMKFIEKLILRLKTKSRALSDYQPRLKAYIKNLKNIRNKIKVFMSETCFKFDRSKASDILSKFVQAIALKGFPIYTTNYDFVFEWVAEHKDIVIHDNFVIKDHRHIWNDHIKFPTGNALTIIKLHGSVTWYAEKSGIIEKIPHDTSISSAGKDIGRLVIFPTRFKDIYDQHFFALYSHFLTALSTAKCLIVIGHSLRDDYLKAGIIERYSKGNFQIIFIDPNFPSDLPSEMKPIPRNLLHIPYQFETFSDDLTDIIKNNSLDIAQKCANIVHQNSKTNKIKLRGNIGSLKVGQRIKFKVTIDAYIPQNKRPAYVRVWFGANYILPTGIQTKETSANFIDKGEVKVATKLSGMVKDKEIDFAIDVPEYTKWLELESVEKIILYVGLLTTSSKKPSQLSTNSILAEDRRELLYSR